MVTALRSRIRSDYARPSRAKRGFARAVAWCGAYASWVIVLRLLVLTFVTYFVMNSNATHMARFEDISEAFGSNEITLVGISALIFVVILKLLNPITTTTTAEIFTPQRIEKNFLPGFFHGALVGSGLILAFLLSGLYRYLGFIIQFEDVHISMPGIVIRIGAVLGWVYCEEFVFRGKILKYSSALPFSLSSDPKRAALLAQVAAVGMTALVYCAVKMLQFDLGWMHLLTLFLVSVALSMRMLADGDFVGGAGFWAAILIIFHPILSLPIFGNEFSGIVLIKHQAGIELDLEAQAGMTRFLGGGAGGPLASFAFQLLLILDIVRGILRFRRTQN